MWRCRIRIQYKLIANTYYIFKQLEICIGIESISFIGYFFVYKNVQLQYLLIKFQLFIDFVFISLLTI